MSQSDVRHGVDQSSSSPFQGGASTASKAGIDVVS